MTPTIGQIVYYTRGDSEFHPAIVTKVWSDMTINLHVFFDNQPSQYTNNIQRLDETVIVIDAKHSSRGWKWSL
jgi:hypothetical protein